MATLSLWQVLEAPAADVHPKSILAIVEYVPEWWNILWPPNDPQYVQTNNANPILSMQLDGSRNKLFNGLLEAS
jgi:hypothetical protein